MKNYTKITIKELATLLNIKYTPQDRDIPEYLYNEVDELVKVELVEIYHSYTTGSGIDIDCYRLTEAGERFIEYFENKRYEVNI